METNNMLRYKIATLIIKEIAHNGRFTRTSFFEQRARNELLNEMVEDDERFFDLYVDSAKDLLIQYNLLKLSENGNVADLTEEGYNASKFNSILDYLQDINKKERTKLLIDKVSKIAPVITALVALISIIAGYITGHASIGIIVTLLLIGIAIGFFINESLRKIYG